MPFASALSRWCGDERRDWASRRTASGGSMGYEAHMALHGLCWAILSLKRRLPAYDVLSVDM
jgi:hypothetical protein